MKSASIQTNRLFTNILSHNLEASKDFYLTLFDLSVNFNSDWFVHLRAKNESLELGIIAYDHEIVPSGVETPIQGCYLTFVVDDVDAVFEKAKAAQFKIIEEPKDMFYGQRRLLVKDPDGSMIDVSALISSQR